jgi:hypothetical protein
LGIGLEVISGAATAPGATFTAWTMAAGNSLQVRAAAIDAKTSIIGAWGFNQVAGVLRIRSPRMHDFAQGIRMRISAANTEPLYPNSGDGGFLQPVIPQDTLTVEQTGSAVGGQIEGGSILIYYQNLPSINGRFIDNATLQKNGVNIIGQEVSITTGVTIGYSGQVAINNPNDNFKANTDYALIGADVDTRVATIRVTGIDTGNLGVGIPGEPTQRHVGANWFSRLSMSTGLPCIPVFNSQNKQNILVDAFGNQGAITTVVTLWMVELMANSVSPAKQGV